MIDKAPLARAGQYLTFTLQSQTFGIPIEVVREINQLPALTPIPNTPDCVAGVINLRDKVVPVVDLRAKFNLERRAHTRETCVIVVDGRQGLVAAIVDTVASVLPIGAQHIEPPPQLVQSPGMGSALIGLGKVSGEVVILLDMLQVVDQEAIHLVTDLRSLAHSS